MPIDPPDLQPTSVSPSSPSQHQGAALGPPLLMPPINARPPHSRFVHPAAVYQAPYEFHLPSTSPQVVSPAAYAHTHPLLPQNFGCHSHMHHIPAGCPPLYPHIPSIGYTQGALPPHLYPAYGGPYTPSSAPVQVHRQLNARISAAPTAAPATPSQAHTNPGLSTMRGHGSGIGDPTLRFSNLDHDPGPDGRSRLREALDNTATALHHVEQAHHKLSALVRVPSQTKEHRSVQEGSAHGKELAEARSKAELERVQIEEERARIEEERARIEGERARIKGEREMINAERVKVEEDNARVKREKETLKEEKEIFEEEKETLTRDKETLKAGKEQMEMEKKTLEEGKEQLKREEKMLNQEKKQVKKEQETLKYEKEQEKKSKELLDTIDETLRKSLSKKTEVVEKEKKTLKKQTAKLAERQKRMEEDTSCVEGEKAALAAERARVQDEEKILREKQAKVHEREKMADEKANTADQTMKEAHETLNKVKEDSVRVEKEREGLAEGWRKLEEARARMTVEEDGSMHGDGSGSNNEDRDEDGKQDKSAMAGEATKSIDDQRLKGEVHDKLLMDLACAEREVEKLERNRDTLEEEMKEDSEMDRQEKERLETPLRATTLELRTTEKACKKAEEEGLKLRTQLEQSQAEKTYLANETEKSRRYGRIWQPKGNAKTNARSVATPILIRYVPADTTVAISPSPTTTHTTMPSSSSKRKRTSSADAGVDNRAGPSFSVTAFDNDNHDDVASTNQTRRHTHAKKAKTSSKRDNDVEALQERADTKSPDMIAIT